MFWVLAAVVSERALAAVASEYSNGEMSGKPSEAPPVKKTLELAQEETHSLETQFAEEFSQQPESSAKRSNEKGQRNNNTKETERGQRRVKREQSKDAVEIARCVRRR